MTISSSVLLSDSGKSLELTFYLAFKRKRLWNVKSERKKFMESFWVKIKSTDLKVLKNMVIRNKSDLYAV